MGTEGVTGTGIVDSHVHLLPGRIGEKVRAIFEAGERSGRFRLAYPAGHAGTVAILRSEGVTGIWSFPYAHRTDVAEGLNESSAGIARQFSDSGFEVTGGGTVHPTDDDPAAVVTRALSVHGLKVLKLHCSVGDFRIDDPRLTPALSVAEEAAMPVIVHLGHSADGLTEEHELDAVGTVCARHPALPFVLAHCGHHSAPAAARFFIEHPNFHADLTPVVTAPPDISAEVLAAHHDRILFGSDAPNTAIRVTDHLAWLDSFGLPAAARDAVTGGNARRLVAAVG